jgi:hypothetical protein
MQKSFKHKTAVFFTIFFMGIITAPTIISSMDDTVDISSFYGIGEEEESESFKLLFENTSEVSENSFIIDTDAHLVAYTYKKYPKPHLNLISPPPEGHIL